MHTQRGLLSIAACGLLLASTPAMRFVAAGSHVPSSARRAPAACTLLTTGEATTALEVPSRPGKELVNSTGCVWSSDPEASDTIRRVTLVTHSLISFQAAMRPAITTIKVEPVTGIGDQAFYQIYPRDQDPFIWVKKGNVAFDIRIMRGSEAKPFTIDQAKGKEAVLARAAAGRL